MTSLIPIDTIVSKILYLRGEKVLLDRDRAKLYGVETRVLKQAVRRNIERFPLANLVSSVVWHLLFGLSDIRPLTSEI